MKSSEMLQLLNLQRGTCPARYIRRAWRYADEDGTIQAHDMIKLDSDPTRHTTSSLRNVLIRAGCKEVAE